MIDIFKARLKAKTKAAGVNLSQKRIDAYADRLHKKNPDVKEEAEHDTLIDALDELVIFKEVAKEDDQLRTLEAKVKAIPPAPEKKDDDADDDDDDIDDDSQGDKDKKDTAKDKKSKARTPKWAQELRDEIRSLKSEKSQSTIRTKISEKLKDDEGNPKVPERFYSKRPLPEKEEDIDTWVEEVSTDWTELTKDSPVTTEKKTATGHKPNRSNTKTDAAPTKEEIDKILD
ncbi:MAG: hypothetical protein H7Y42_12320 [Chitinophagaceae bacterium]|nr:hypothetical protein [Chitinophagaceae bacterium]